MNGGVWRFKDVRRNAYCFGGLRVRELRGLGLCAQGLIV